MADGGAHVRANQRRRSIVAMRPTILPSIMASLADGAAVPNQTASERTSARSQSDRTRSGVVSPFPTSPISTYRSSYRSSAPSHGGESKLSRKDRNKGGIAGVSGKSAHELEMQLLEYKKECELRDELLQGVQRNYQAVSMFCSENVKEIAELKERLENCQKELSDWKAQARGYNEAKKLLQQYSQENRELQAKKVESAQEQSALQKKCQEYQGHIADLNDIKEDLTNQLSRTQQLAHQRSDEIEALNNELNDAEKKKRLDDFKSANDQLSKELFKAFEEINYQKSCAKKQNVEMQKLRNKLRRTELDFGNCKVDVQRLKAADRGYREQANLLTAQLLEAKEQAANFELELHSLQSRTKISDRKNPELEAKLKFANDSLKTLQTQFDDAWEAKKRAEKELKEKIDELKIMEEKLDRLGGRSGMEQAEYEAKLDALQTSKDHLQNKKLDQDKRIASLESELKEQDEQLKVYIKKNQEQRKQLQQLGSHVEALEDAPPPKPVERKVQVEKVIVKPDQKTLEALDIANQRLAQLEEADKQQKTLIKKLQKENSKLENEFAEQTKRINQRVEELDKEKEAYAEFVRKEFADKLTKIERDMQLLNGRLMEEQQMNAEMTAILESNKRRLSEEEIEIFRRKETELRATVAKLMMNEEASEASFTCFQCMKIFTDPVTCIPCGHSYCEQCVETAGHCTQCGPEKQIQYYKNELLDDLATRYNYRKQALAGLITMTEKAVFTKA